MDGAEMTRCITTKMTHATIVARHKSGASQKWRVTKVVYPDGDATKVVYPDGYKVSTNGDTEIVAYPYGDTEIVARRKCGLDAMRQSHYSGADAARHRDILRASAHVHTCVCM